MLTQAYGCAFARLSLGYLISHLRRWANLGTRVFRVPKTYSEPQPQPRAAVPHDFRAQARAPPPHRAKFRALGTPAPAVHKHLGAQARVPIRQAQGRLCATRHYPRFFLCRFSARFGLSSITANWTFLCMWSMRSTITRTLSPME